MPVCENEADEIAAPRLNESDVRHDDLDPWRALVAESDAEIYHQPLAGMTIQIEVHADLACPAQGAEQELAGRRWIAQADPLRLRRKISTRPRIVISGSWCSITGVALVNSGARPPVATTISSPPNSARMRATSPSIRPT